MTDMPIGVVIEDVSLSGNSATVSLLFQNRSAEPVLIDPLNICSGGVEEWPLFRITDRKGEVVGYRGLVSKRGEPDFRSFIPIAPHASFRATCNTGDNYDLRAQAGPLTFQYVTDNLHPTEIYFRLESNVFRTD